MSIRSFIIEYLRYVIMIGGLGILLAAESVMPVVMDEGPAWRHTLRNLAIGAIYVATGTAVGLGVAWAAARTAEHQLGLFYATALPAWISARVSAVPRNPLPPAMTIFIGC